MTGHNFTSGSFTDNQNTTLKSLSDGKLERLVITAEDWKSEKYREALLQALGSSSCLRAVQAADIGFSNDDASKLFTGLYHHPFLVALDISNNNLSSEAAEFFAKNIIPSISVLNIANNKIGNSGAAAIAHYQKNLIGLNVANNNIGEVGAKALSDQLKCLVALNIKGNSIGAKGAIFIAENLKNLRALDIANNNIGFSGAFHISQDLKKLDKLSIDANNIGEAGVTALVCSMKGLNFLSLDYNNNTGNGYYAIEHSGMGSVIDRSNGKSATAEFFNFEKLELPKINKKFSYPSQESVGKQQSWGSRITTTVNGGGTYKQERGEAWNKV